MPPAPPPIPPPSTAPSTAASTSAPSECHLCSRHATSQRHRTTSKRPDSSARAESSAAHGEEGLNRESSNHHVDSKGHDLLYAPEDFDAKTYGIAGRIVKRIGVFSYALFFVVPLTFVSIFFAIIPLGEPQTPTISEQWVFVFVSNVAVMIAMSYLYNAAFLMLADCERPFRTSLFPLLGVLVAEIAVMLPVLLTVGVFRYLGIAALAVCYLALFVSMYFAYPDLRGKLHSFFRRFMTLLILYIPILVGFVIAYREVSSGVAQSALSFGMAFLTFVYRRIMLSRLDPFPLDPSQLFAGFWVQNLGDCTAILAFPQVNSASVFAAVFLSNSISNVAFLGFVSDPWIYHIRPVLKTYVKEAFKCNFPIPPIPKPDETFDPVNRGHDNNIGGYRRRQFRFFFFRLLSQAVAMTNYLAISPMLRYGLNKQFTPLSTIDYFQYRNSMIYAASNLVFIFLVALLGYYFLNKKHHQTFHEIREIHRHDFVHHTMVGMVTAIITHNMIMTVAIILSQYCLFASFKDCRLTS